MRLLICLIFSMGIFGLLEGTECHKWNRKVVKSYCKQILKEKGWRLTDEGSSYSTNTEGGRLEAICLGFDGPGCVSLEEARRLIVAESERLIVLLSRSQRKGVRLFTSRDLEYGLAFSGGPYRFPAPPYIATVSLINDKLFYRFFDPVVDSLITVYQEPYEEAVRIVEEEKLNYCAESASPSDDRFVPSSGVPKCNEFSTWQDLR